MIICFILLKILVRVGSLATFCVSWRQEVEALISVHDLKARASAEKYSHRIKADNRLLPGDKIAIGTTIDQNFRKSHNFMTYLRNKIVWQSEKSWVRRPEFSTSNYNNFFIFSMTDYPTESPIREPTPNRKLSTATFSSMLTVTQLVQQNKSKITQSSWKTNLMFVKKQYF